MWAAGCSVERRERVMGGILVAHRHHNEEWVNRAER
jgi:hypothetical protein